MTRNAIPEGAWIGEWQVWPRAGRVARGGEQRSLEPKVMDLLSVLAAQPGEVVTHEEIFAALWPDTIVGDDTLARTVSKLRRAFDDDAKSPAYVETIPKRGYRLIAPVTAATEGAAPPPRANRRLVSFGAAAAAIVVALAGVALMQERGSAYDPVIARAKDHYYQYTRADNETAIALYEQVLAAEPDNAEAQAGLATALVQRVLRWPNAPGEVEFARTTLGEALATGRTDTPQAQAWLARAGDLAARAARTAPRDPFAHQAHGLALAASRQFDDAEAAYRRAITADADAWGAMINLGDLNDIRGDSAAALTNYEQAYAAMERAYAREPQRVRHWQSEVGALIGERRVAMGDVTQAELWFRRVLERTPLHERSVVGLARLLKQSGDAEGAARLCSELAARSASGACDQL